MDPLAQRLLDVYRAPSLRGCEDRRGTHMRRPQRPRSRQCCCRRSSSKAGWAWGCTVPPARLRPPLQRRRAAGFLTGPCGGYEEANVGLRSELWWGLHKGQWPCQLVGRAGLARCTSATLPAALTERRACRPSTLHPAGQTAGCAPGPWYAGQGRPRRWPSWPARSLQDRTVASACLSAAHGF